MNPKDIIQTAIEETIAEARSEIRRRWALRIAVIVIAIGLAGALLR